MGGSEGKREGGRKGERERVGEGGGGVDGERVRLTWGLRQVVLDIKVERNHVNKV